MACRYRTIRLGLARGFGDDGLPIGLQLVTERGQDHLLLRLTRDCERIQIYCPWGTRYNPATRRCEARWWRARWR